MRGTPRGSVVECLNRDQGVAGSSLTGASALCPWASHFILCLVLVKPWTTRPAMTEKTVDWDVKNQIKHTNNAMQCNAIQYVQLVYSALNIQLTSTK